MRLLQTHGGALVDTSHAVITVRGLFLMQLRDFNQEIAFPGHWGFFGGHREVGENAYDTIYRELEEELGIKFSDLECLGDLWLEKTRRTSVFAGELLFETTSISLGEGQEFGVFPTDEILSASLPSRKFGKSFPVTPGAMATFQFYLSVPVSCHSPSFKLP